MKSSRENLAPTKRIVSARHALALVVLVVSLTVLAWTFSKRRLNQALIEAVKVHDTQLASRLLDTGADPNSQDLQGKSLVMSCSQFVRHLLNARTQSPNGPSALLVLLDRSDRSELGRPNDLNLLIALLNKGADPNVSNGYGLSLLRILGHAPGEHLEVVRALLKHGADVNERSRDGETVIMDWSVLVDAKLVQLLLDRGADVNIQGNDGSTPLIRATRTNKPQTVRVLLAHGARAGTTDKRGHTAAYYAQSAGFAEVSNYLKSASNSYIQR